MLSLKAPLTTGRRVLPPENVVVVEIGRHVGARRRRGARRLWPRGTRAPRGGGRPIGLRNDVEERPQLVDVAEAPPGAAGGQTRSARVTRRSTTHFCSVCESRNRWVFPSSVVSIHDGVGVTGRSGCGTGGGVPADRPGDLLAIVSGRSRAPDDEGVPAGGALNGGATLRDARVIELVFGLTAIATYVHLAETLTGGTRPALRLRKHTTPADDD